MKKSISTLLAVSLLVASCTHTSVKTRNTFDDKLSCADISAEFKQLETIEQDINDKTGVSTRNVGMFLVFWPGIFVNQMNAGDARKAIEKRKDVLAQINKEKNCNNFLK